MGLEQFSNDDTDDEEVIELNATDNSGSQSNSNKYNIKSSVDKNIDKYKQAAVEMLKERGEWPSKNYWNEHKDEYGITTWGGDLESQIGVSFNNLLLLAGANPLDIHWQEFDEYYIDASLYLAASIYGEDFNAMEIQDTNGLVHTDLVKRVTGDTFAERKDKLGLGVQKGKWDREEVKDIIDDKFNRYETKSSREIDKRCPFTQSVIKRFGDGSFVDGMKELGYSVSQKQQSSSDGHRKADSAPSKVKKILSNISSYEKDADGYIYLLELTELDNTFYYIGETVDIVHRMVKHQRQGGSVNSIVEVDGEIVSTNEIDFDINILAVKSIYSNSNNNIEDILEKLEREKYNEACSRGKLPTKDGVIELPHEKLLGGK